MWDYIARNRHRLTMIYRQSKPTTGTPAAVDTSAIRIIRRLPAQEHNPGDPPRPGF